MISIILAAGSGTRIRPLSYFLPKILLPVKGKPVLEHILANMDGLDIEMNYVVVSEREDVIRNYIEKTNLERVTVVKGLGWETGGDFSLAIEQIPQIDDAIVTNGDIVTDIKISDIYGEHRKRSNLVTIGIFELDDREEARRFGRTVLDNNGRITSFDEKGSNKEDEQVLVNTGFYVFDKKLLEQREKYLIPRRYKLEIDLFPLLSSERKLGGYITKPSYWWDVGTIESYLKAEQYLMTGHRIIPP